MSDQPIELTRRKALAAVGTVGVASAGAGLGTTAYFSDTEQFANNQLTAGSLDMKVGYSAHYSDWSDGEGEGVSVRMYDGGANKTGSSSDLEEDEVGLPTNDAWLIAVSPDDSETNTKQEAATQFLDNTEYADVGDVVCPEGTDDDDINQPVIELEDVKPGDFGEVTFDFILCDNPGYVWLKGSLESAKENGLTEPEKKDGDEDGDADSTDPAKVELLDEIQVAYWVDDGDNYQDGVEEPDFTGSLRDALDSSVTDSIAADPSNGDYGARLEGDIDAEEGGGTEGTCFSAKTEHSVAFAWWLPVDHANEIQTDSAKFNLGFYTEQCRHNDGSGQPSEQ